MQIKRNSDGEILTVKAFSFGEGLVGNRRIALDECRIVDSSGCDIGRLAVKQLCQNFAPYVSSDSIPNAVSVHLSEALPCSLPGEPTDLDHQHPDILERLEKLEKHFDFGVDVKIVELEKRVSELEESIEVLKPVSLLSIDTIKGEDVSFPDRNAPLKEVIDRVILLEDDIQKVINSANNANTRAANIEKYVDDRYNNLSSSVTESAIGLEKLREYTISRFNEEKEFLNNSLSESRTRSEQKILLLSESIEKRFLRDEGISIDNKVEMKLRIDSLDNDFHQLEAAFDSIDSAAKTTFNSLEKKISENQKTALNNILQMQSKLDQVDNDFTAGFKIAMDCHQKNSSCIERLSKVVGYNFNKLMEDHFDFEGDSHAEIIENINSSLVEVIKKSGSMISEIESLQLKKFDLEERFQTFLKNIENDVYEQVEKDMGDDYKAEDLELDDDDEYDDDDDDSLEEADHPNDLELEKRVNHEDKIHDEKQASLAALHKLLERQNLLRVTVQDSLEELKTLEEKISYFDVEMKEQSKTTK